MHSGRQIAMAADLDAPPSLEEVDRSILDDRAADDERCLLRRYLDSGGRVVWLGLSPFLLELDPATGKPARCFPSLDRGQPRGVAGGASGAIRSLREVRTMPTAKMTSKGQVTIPKRVRQRLRLGTGDQVEFVLQEAGTVLLRPLDRPVRELFGILPRTEGAAPSLEEVDRSILDDRAADDERIRSKRG